MAVIRLAAGLAAAAAPLTTPFLVLVLFVVVDPGTNPGLIDVVIFIGRVAGPPLVFLVAAHENSSIG
jgi:hypothetical protein